MGMQRGKLALPRDWGVFLTGPLRLVALGDRALSYDGEPLALLSVRANSCSYKCWGHSSPL